MFSVEPIGYVRSSRSELADDDWDRVSSRIELCETVPPESLDGLLEFSHAEVIFVFDRVAESELERGRRHPRGNPAWPKVGIFAQRAKDRPNRLGSTIVAIAGRAGGVLDVIGLDAVDGTPVLDIKPVMSEFLPRTELRQPAWSRELMRGYWKAAHEPVALLNQLNLVVRDMAAALEFYRRLGLDLPADAASRSGGHHAELTLPNGFVLEFDSAALARVYNAGARKPGGGSSVVGFALASRERVDALYAELVEAGHPGAQAPFDAFWGARYAVVADPDGNHVGLMSPLDPARRTRPPALP